MTDRQQAIKTLEDIITTAEGIKGLSDDAGITIGLDKIDSLKFALESIKVDRAYDLAYEKVDFIEIPEGATNRTMIKAMFPELKLSVTDGKVFVRNKGDIYLQMCFSWDWWNSPYRKENNNG